MKKTFDKTEIRLASFDIDETIYTDGRRDGTYEEFMSTAVSSAMVRLSQTGIKTVLATGRGHYSLPRCIMDLGIFRYAVCNNGTIVWDFEKDCPVLWRPFDSKLVYGLFKLLPTLTDTYYATFDKEYRRDPKNWHQLTQKQRSVELFNVLAKNSHNVFKVGCRFNSIEAAEQAAIKIREKFDVEAFVVEHIYLEITPKGVHKGNGLAVLCKHLGVELSNVIAFGDSGNDVDLFKLVRYAVAVENGQESAKKAADYIAPGVQNDGVAKAIKELFGI